jgi:hypothetical protein
MRRLMVAIACGSVGDLSSAMFCAMSSAARVDSIAADMSGQSLASPCRSWRYATISRSVSFFVMVLVFVRVTGARLLVLDGG